MYRVSGAMDSSIIAQDLIVKQCICSHNQLKWRTYRTKRTT